MAEIGLIASVIQVAGAGLKLSQTLYQYADTVTNADRRIKDIAKEVQLTSFVIDELAHIFKQDQSSAILSENAIKTADETVKECSTVFQELEAALKKTKKNTLGRLMLPFRETKIDLLRNHIDKLKSTLQLLMQVLTHAHQVASQKLDREGEVAQREQIKQLLRNKKKSTTKYEESLRNYTGSDEEFDEEIEDSKMSKDLLMTVSSISSSITTKSLAACVKHIQGLLDDIEQLQQSLSDDKEGKDPSEHHQSLVGSYFRARGHLDSVLLGNPTSGVRSETTSLKQSEVNLPIERKLTGSTLEASESRTSEDIEVLTNGGKGQHEWLGMSEKDFDAAFKAAILKAQEEARKEERDKLAETNAKERQNAEEEAQRALEVARKAEEELYRAAKDAEKQARAEAEAKAALEAEAKAAREREPIKFEDAMGRKFSFPFIYVSTWPGMRRLIDQAFSTVDSMKPHVDELRYDLLGPSGETILPTLWNITVQPGWTIKMRMRRGFDLKSMSKREARQSRRTTPVDPYNISMTPLTDSDHASVDSSLRNVQISGLQALAMLSTSEPINHPEQRPGSDSLEPAQQTQETASQKSNPKYSGHGDLFIPPIPSSYTPSASFSIPADPVVNRSQTNHEYQTPAHEYHTIPLPRYAQQSMAYNPALYSQYSPKRQYSIRGEPGQPYYGSIPSHDTYSEQEDDDDDNDISLAALATMSFNQARRKPNPTLGDSSATFFDAPALRPPRTVVLPQQDHSKRDVNEPKLQTPAKDVEERKARIDELKLQNDQHQYVKYLKRNPSSRKIKGIEKELEFVQAFLSIHLLDNKTRDDFEARKEELLRLKLNHDTSKTVAERQNTIPEAPKERYIYDLPYHPGFQSRMPHNHPLPVPSGVSYNRPLPPPESIKQKNPFPYRGNYYSVPTNYAAQYTITPEVGRHEDRRPSVAASAYYSPGRISDRSIEEVGARFPALHTVDKDKKSEDALNPSLPSCSICGKQGHIAQNCSWEDVGQQSQPGFVGGYGGNRSVCFSCGDFDHASSECPKGQKCQNCGQIGHTSYHCTSTTAQGSIVADESKLTEINAEDLMDQFGWPTRRKKAKKGKRVDSAEIPHSAENSSHLENNESGFQNETEEKTTDLLPSPVKDNELVKPEETLLGEEEIILNEEEQLILDREAEIREIEKGMTDLNELFRNVGRITSEQGSQLDSITENAAIVRNDGALLSTSREAEIEQQRRTQNKAAQRKFREKVREQRDRYAEDKVVEVGTQHKQGFKVKTEEDDGSGLSGLPWGSMSMRHVVADPGLSTLNPSTPGSGLKSELQTVEAGSGHIDEMDDEIDELLKEWTTVLG